MGTKRQTTLHFALAGAVLAAASNAGCQLSEHHLTHDGLERTYYLHEPNGAGGPRPLVVVLHGAATDGPQAAEMTRMNGKSDDEGFLVAYPDGTGSALQRTWNAGVCCDPALASGVDDVGFIDAVIRDIEGEHDIDPRRIYLAGFSNGAMMALLCACELADRVAAVAAVAGALDITACSPSQPVSVIAFHGKDDERVDDQGGNFPPAYGGQTYPSIDDVITFWAIRNNCIPAGPPSPGPVEVEQHIDCDDQTEVVLYLIQGGNHSWPGGRQASVFGQPPTTLISATDLSWDFFEQHPKP